MLVSKDRRWSVYRNVGLVQCAGMDRVFYFRAGAEVNVVAFCGGVCCGCGCGWALRGGDSIVVTTAVMMLWNLGVVTSIIVVATVGGSNSGPFYFK